MATATSNQKRRNASIDILRIAAMLGIILFHHFGTKVPNAFASLPSGFAHDAYYYDVISNATGCVQKLSLIMDFCYGHFGNGCNFIFMLVTGYFLFGRSLTIRKRTKSVVKVILALVFYGVLLTIINFAMLAFIRPQVESMPTNLVFTLPNWLSGENMWYLQAYGIFILIVLPLLKLFEDKLTREIHGCVCIALVCIHLLAYQTYLPNLPLSGKLVYFIMCYYIGGYVKTHGVRLSLKQLVGLLAAYVIAYLCYEYYWRYSNMVLHAPHEYSYIKVMQPFICCIAFSFLCFAIATKIHLTPREGVSKALGSVAATTIGIYIFHFNTVGFSFIIANKYWWHDWSTKGFFLFSIIDTLLLFAISCIIELLRQRLMAFIHSRRQRKLAPTSQEERAGQAPNTVVSE